VIGTDVSGVSDRLDDALVTDDEWGPHEDEAPTEDGPFPAEPGGEIAILEP